MAQSVRYQVFVSSTFTDLKEERAEVIQALWELDCIPTGMEAFLATNESQWEVIQKVIDECDYYILIIGGRYGSVTADGISYTEKEYKYAKKLGIPVLCFVHGEPENIPVSKTEKDEVGRTRLNDFRNRVMEEHPIRRWTSPQELGGLVSRSVSRAIKVNPRPGWMRNEGPSNLELLEQINFLTKENQKLKDKTKNSDSVVSNVDDLESGSDEINIKGSMRITNSKTHDVETYNWNSRASWDDIFKDIGPLLIHEATERDIKTSISKFIGWSSEYKNRKGELRWYEITPETFAEIIIQLRALGLIDKGIRKRAVSDKGSYWTLTEIGERHLVGLLARRKNKSIETPDSLSTQLGNLLE